MDVLLIEDNDKTRDLYEQMLESEGIDVDTASDGFDGYRKVKATSYKLILLDIMMPLLDGVALLQKMRAEGVKSDVAIFTNLSREEILGQVKKYGIVDYFVKSDINPDQFVQRVKKLIN